MSETYTNEGHAESFLEKKWEECKKEELCDVVMIAGNEERRIPAHRYVLEEESGYFHEISTTKEVQIPDINGDILRSLVKYCYKGNILINEDNVEELLKTAHKLRFRQVVSNCIKFLLKNLSCNNCLKTITLAKQYGFDMSHRKTKKLEDFMKVCETEEFLQLNVEGLRQFLESELCVTTGEDVFNSLNKWMQHNPIERERYKAELLKLVQKPFLDPNFLIQHVRPICTSIECLQVYADTWEYLYLSNGNMLNKENLIQHNPPSSFPSSPLAVQFWIGISSDERVNKMYIYYALPPSHKWEKCLKELEYRYRFGSVIMKNVLYITGGFDAKGNILKTVISINLKTMTVSELAPMHEQRRWGAAAALNGVLYAVSGDDGSNHLSSVEKLDPEKNEWVKMCPLLDNRSNPAVAVLNNKLYAVGGYIRGRVSDDVECYDPDTNEWKRMAPMQEARQSPGVAVANGFLYAVGGFKTTKAERYDPQKNEWKYICEISKMLCPDDSCFTVNDKVVVYLEDHFEEYDVVHDKWNMTKSADYPDDIFPMITYKSLMLTSRYDDM